MDPIKPINAILSDPTQPDDGTLPPVVLPPISPPNPPKRSPPRETPRLSILHFLVWMTLVAICLSIDKLLQNQAGDEMTPEKGGVILVRGLYGSVGLAGWLLFVSRKFRRIPFLTQPGEWLLLSRGIEYFVYVVMFLISKVHISLLESGRASFIFNLLFRVLFGAMYLIAGVRSREFPRWRVIFFALLGGTVLHTLIFASYAFFWIESIVFPTLRWMNLFATILPFVFICVGIALDFRERSKLTWTHWFGTISTFLFASYLGIRYILVFLILV